MKIKKLLIGFLLLLLPLTCSGDWYEDAYQEMIAMPKFPAGMTYLAIYNDELLDADRSGGVPTSTPAAARDATHPKTYFDANGIMQVTTTADTGAFNHGYYDTTDFHLFTHAGYYPESASTNYLKQSIFAADGNSDGVADDWAGAWPLLNGTPVTTLVDVKLTFNVGTTVQAQRWTYTGVLGDAAGLAQIGATKTGAGTFAQDDEVTDSLWIKGSYSGISHISLYISEYDAAGTSGTHHIENIHTLLSSTEWRRVTYSITLVDADASQLGTKIFIDGIDDGDTWDIQFTCYQLEKSPFATSFIPTTTASLTRNAETNKYEILGNRTAAVESCVVKLAPEFADGLAGNRYFLDTDTEQRYFLFFGNSDDVWTTANITGSPLCSVSTIVNESWTANTEMTLGYAMQSGTSPYIAGYFDGVADGTNETTDDFTAPAWGTYFWVGGRNIGTNQLNGTIFSIAFFDRVLSVEEMSFLHSKDWRTLR